MQQLPTFRRLDSFKVDMKRNGDCTKGVLRRDQSVAEGGDATTIDSLVRGSGLRLDDLPPTSPKFVRLYMTFARDVVELKRLLAEEELPRLRDYYLQRHGVELQIVMEQDSWKMEKSSFENLLKILEENEKDSSVLVKWFTVDDKSRPVGQCVRVHQRNVRSQNGGVGGVDGWKDAKLKIEALIQYGAENAKSDAVKKDLYRILASECGIRLAAGLEQDPNATGKTGELWENNDPSPTELRVSVTNDCQEVLLVVEEQIQQNSSSRRFEKTQNNKKQLALSVGEYLRQLIDEVVPDRESSSMMREILHHWTVAKSLCQNYVGHLDTLQLIREYIFGETVQPLVLVGESGTGKSATMAEAAILAGQLLNSEDKRLQSAVMVRFCGHTYDSQRSSRLISSLAEQFLCAADREPTRLSPWHLEAKQLLGDVMRNGDYRGLLVVFVDAINDLGSADDEDDFLDWLPARIANNVKVIVSCDCEGGTLERLRQKVTNHANIIRLSQLTADQCIQFLNSLLEQSERKLTAEQWTSIEDALAHCQLPLYVQLLHDALSRCASSSGTPKQVLEDTVEKCALYKFKNLEETHGISLTSNALGFLVAEPGGLSDCEMEEMLSLNHDVIKAIPNAGEIKNISRCASVAWVRFRDELGCHLAVGNAGELTVLRIAHRCLKRVAETRYAKSPSLKTSLHSQIADYFLDTPGPDLPNTMTWERLNQSERNVPHASMYQDAEGSRSTPNYRKLDLLPYHLHRSGRFRELFELVYFNLHWIYAKLVFRSTKELLTDFQMVKDPEVSLVAEAISLAEPTLARDPRLLGVELSGRLFHYSKTHDCIRSLLDQCDRSAVHLCPLVPLGTTFSPAGATLQRVVSISDGSSLTRFNVMENNGRLLLMQKDACDLRMRVWNITSGERRADVVLTSGSEVFLSPDGKFGSVIKESTLRIYHLESGDLFAEVEFGPGSVSCTASAGRYLALGFDQAQGPVVIDIENGFLLRRLPYRSRSLAISDDLKYFVCNSGETLAIHTFPLLERKATVVLSAVAEKIVFSRESGTVKVFAMLGDRSLQVVTFHLQKRTGSTQTIFQDFDLKDFKLSHHHSLNNLRILVSLSKSLYVLNVVSTSQWTPRRLHVDHSSLDDAENNSKAILDAGFSMDDRLVMAIRGCYLCLWDMSSAQLIRLLTFSEAPVVRMFPLDNMNAALTIGSDFSACLWNLNRLTTESERLASCCTDRVIRGGVRHIATATSADKFICAGSRGCAMAVGSLLNPGKWEHFDDSSNDSGVEGTVEYVGISNAGNYAITRMTMPGLDGAVGDNNSGMLGNLMVKERQFVKREDTIWDLRSGGRCRPIHRVENSVDAVFSSDESKVAFSVFRRETFPRGESVAVSEVIVFDLKKCDGRELHDASVHLLVDNAIAKTVFTVDYSFLAFVQHFSDGNINSDHQLSVYSFEEQWSGLRCVNGSTLLVENHNHDNIDKKADSENKNTNNVVLVDMKAVKGAVILITIEVGTLTTLQKPLQNTQDARRRIAVLYDVREDSVLNRIEPFLHPSSDVQSTVMLQHGTTFVDNNCNVFKVGGTDGHQQTFHVGQLKLDIRSVMHDLCFVLDGRYAVAIVNDGGELVLVRTEDGMQERGRVETHCRASVIAVCSDGQSVIVGCEDGRIMMFKVVVEEVDPPLAFMQSHHQQESFKSTSTD